MSHINSIANSFQILVFSNLGKNDVEGLRNGLIGIAEDLEGKPNIEIRNLPDVNYVRLCDGRELIDVVKRLYNNCFKQFLSD